MRIRHLAIASTVALVISACSGGAAETTTTAPAPTTPTTVVAPTTVAPTTTVPPTTTTTLPPVPERLAFLGGPDTAEFTEKVVTVIHRPGVIDSRVTTTVEGRFSAPSDYAYTVRTGSGTYSEVSEIVTLGFDHWVLQEHKQWRSADTWDIWYRSFHSEHGLASSDIDLDVAYEVLADAEYELEVRNGLDVRVYELDGEALDSAIEWGDFTGDYFEGAVTESAATLWISDTTYDLLELSLFTNLDIGNVEGVDEGTTAEIMFTLVIDSINETIAEITEPDVPVYADVPEGFLPYSDAAVGIDFVYPEDWMISLDDDSFYFYGEPVVNFFDGLTGTDVTLEMLDLSRFAGMPLDDVVEFFDDEFTEAGLERISRDAVAIANRDGVSSRWETVIDDMVVYFELSLAFDGERALVMISTVDEFAMPYVGLQLEALVDSIELSEPSESVAG